MSFGDLFAASETSADIVESLDAEQRAAALAGDGAILVRAGAGTGKTRTLVARIVHLVRDRRVDPWQITAVTFTKKAAREIRERVGSVLGWKVASAISIGTFHSLSVRVLRRHPEAAGLKPGFIVVPEEDARKLVQFAVEDAGIVPTTIAPEERRRMIAVRADLAFDRIQSWKSWGLSSKEVADRSRPRRSDDEELDARVYLAYQADLRAANRVDFGDLILSILDLFAAHPDIAREESDHVRHLLVDEAQDANPAQVTWARWMTNSHRNIFVVGDEDQSIFSFQGGYPGALLDLTGEGATHLGLTVNRRCTDQILAPAVNLVGWNRRSRKKELRSGVDGDPVSFRVAGNEKEEANFIASSIKEQVEGGTAYGRIAILARSGWVMQPLEEALLKAGIPYEVVGGVSLMKRREVLVVAAYLRLSTRPEDELAFDRIHAEPTRGVGQAAAAALLSRVRLSPVPFYDAIKALERLEGSPIDTAMRAGLDELALQLQILHRSREHGARTRELVDMIIGNEGIGYRRFIAANGKAAKPRLENLKMLERLADEFPDVEDFLDELALNSDEQEVDPDKVRISTMHSSKGLEWDVVYCPALEMDVAPNKRAIAEVGTGSPSDPWNGPAGGGMDEERRLVHVAFTRARSRLFLSSSLSRAGRRATPSPFLPESGIDPMLAASSTDRVPVKRARPSKAEPRSGRKGFASLGSSYD